LIDLDIEDPEGVLERSTETIISMPLLATV
jgi:hypothetical protein